MVLFFRERRDRIDAQEREAQTTRDRADDDARRADEELRARVRFLVVWHRVYGPDEYADGKYQRLVHVSAKNYGIEPVFDVVLYSRGLNGDEIYDTNRERRPVLASGKELTLRPTTESHPDEPPPCCVMGRVHRHRQSAVGTIRGRHSGAPDITRARTPGLWPRRPLPGSARQASGGRRRPQ